MRQPLLLDSFWLTKNFAMGAMLNPVCSSAEQLRSRMVNSQIQKASKATLPTLIRKDGKSRNMLGLPAKEKATSKLM